LDAGSTFVHCHSKNLRIFLKKPVNSLTRLASWAALLLLGGFFAVVFWNILTRRISLEGLFLGDRRDNNVYFSPGRVQLLIVTLISALYYLLQVVQNPTSFPSVPESWIAALAGSQTLYLGGKAISMLNLGARNSK
jgi:hypothetical protein